MDAALIVLPAALIIATGLVVAAVVLTRPRALGVADASPASADIAALGAQMSELAASQARAVAELRVDVQRALGETEQQVLTHTGTTQRTLGDLSKQLATLGEQSRQVGELAKDIGSLNDLLRAPKLRGGFGELLMEHVLADALPASAYQLQYTYRDGSRVDAVVHFAGRLVPLDAKFPIESFHAIAAAVDDADRKAKRRAFVQQVKRHVDSVARYVSPRDGTIDFAFLYIPSESVFYELISAEQDLRVYCSEKHVIPASPNTLHAYLQLVALGLRGMAMEERTRELHQGIREAALELEKFSGLHDQLGKHIDNAAKKWTESLRSLDRTSDAITALTRTPAPEQLSLAPSVERLLDDGTREIRSP